MNELFFIPDSSERNTSITSNDIELGQLRIGIRNKKYFPNEDCEIIIISNSKEYVCKFRLNSTDKDRSYRIINKQMFHDLNIKEKDILECQKIGERRYNLSK